MSFQICCLIFLINYLLCDHFCCGSLVLEVMPDQTFIGVWRCGSRFKNKTADLKCTFDGLLLGMPRGARGCPGTHIRYIWEFLTCPKVSRTKNLPNCLPKSPVVKSSQIGYFDETSHMKVANL